jgi:hypothetical protein
MFIIYKWQNNMQRISWKGCSHILSKLQFQHKTLGSQDQPPFTLYHSTDLETVFITSDTAIFKTVKQTWQCLEYVQILKGKVLHVHAMKACRRVKYSSTHSLTLALVGQVVSFIP